MTQAKMQIRAKLEIARKYLLGDTARTVRCSIAWQPILGYPFYPIWFPVPWRLTIKIGSLRLGCCREK
jgi:hypothetical protein